MKTYEIAATLLMNIKTDITDDGVSTSETLRYLVEEDLQDLGYTVDDVEVIDNYKVIITNLIEALEDCMRGYCDLDGDYVKEHLRFRDKYDDMIAEYQKLIES